MGIADTVFGKNVTIPETDDRNWGAQGTTILQDIITWADALGYLISGEGALRLKSTDSTLAASATLTPTHPVHRVDGSGGAVTLDGTTAIADGSVAGQVLVLIGTHATNTVKVPNSANTRLNGSVTLALGDVIILWWDSTDSNWVEFTRNN